jgi:cold shock CspA family protein
MAAFQGTVASFDTDQASGFITPADGSTFPNDDGTVDELDDDIYFSAIQLRSSDVNPPPQGQNVTFDIQVDIDGLEAVNITSA